MRFPKFPTLAAGLCAAVLLAPAWLRAQTAGVLREVYANIGGSALSNLTNNAAFPNNPSLETLQPSFEAPTEFADNYGQRMRALLRAPVTGNYTFYIASDDQGALFLGTDATPASKRQIASVAGWTSTREWTREAGQQSALIPLTAGQSYYIEALQKEGGGGDNLSVGWKRPGSNTIEVIPGTYLSPYGLGPPIIIQQPADTNALEATTATFTVRLERMLGATFQWRRNGQALPGQTNSQLTVGPLQVADSLSTFQCFITNSLGSTNSRVATLTVAPDTTAPTLVSVSYLGDRSRLVVLFSEPVDPATAAIPGNYGLTLGAQVLGATLSGEPNAVLLRTTPLEEGVTFTLAVSGVRDRAATPNTIAPNSTLTFQLGYQPLEIGRIQGLREPPGPATRRSPVALTELHYHPAPRTDGRNLEFIELYNSQAWAEDLSGFQINGDIDYTFPSNTVLAARSYLVVAAVPADLQAIHGLSTPHAFTGTLPNGGGTLRLRNPQDAVLWEVTYDDAPPWPVAADGAGHSLVLARASWGQADPQAWSASHRMGGSPGAEDAAPPDPVAAVLINEFLAHTDEPQVDYIELFNYGSASLSLAGCVLTDDPTTNRFVIPAGVIIAPRGHLVFDQAQLGFALNAAGETLYFKNAAGDRILDAVRFGGQANGTSTGRTPDGAREFSPLEQPTPGAPNAARRLPEVVLNEVRFEPIGGDDLGEYVELFNPGQETIDLGGWRLGEGVSFTFPPGRLLPAGGYLVVARDATQLLTLHPHLNPGNTVGNFSGALANRGDRLVLTRPDTVLTTNGTGGVSTNLIHILVDEVAYGSGGRWGRWSAGGGSSLERLEPRADGRRAPNWVDSDESGRSGWVTVEQTGVLDNGNTDATRLELFLLGAGEALVDDVEVIRSGGTGVLANGNFSQGLTGWVPQGNQVYSTLSTNGGIGGSPCLHLKATGRGDTGANRVRAPLTTTLNPGTTATLRARVRWLKGQPDFLMRLKGNWLDATTNLLTTRALGTPAQPNSRRQPNAGPAITDVTHAPVLPAAGAPVTVIARADDPDGIGTFFLRYRVDPATNWISVAMVPRGAGLFSGTIPGQASGRVVAFHLAAEDASPVPARSLFPAEAPDRTGVVVFGARNGAGAFGTYHLWMTARTIDRWSAREKLSNDPLDITFVYGDQRVVYNAGGQYSGSPYHSPAYNSPLGNYCDYVLTFPPDDRLLGETDVNLLLPGNGCCENSLQREQTAYWFARKFGIPFNHRRHVHVFANNQRRAPLLMEDSQQANGDFAEQWWGGEEQGDLHKIQLWFEFDDAATQFSPVGASFGNFTTTGGAKKLARYRWNWARRSAGESINNYTNLFALHTAMLSAASGDVYTRLMDSVLDVEEWTRVVACEHLYGNVDSFAYGGGQNLYVYRPVADRWRLILWDVDFAFLAEAANANLFSFGGDRLNRLLSHPPYRRMYYRALKQAADTFLTPQVSDPVLNARQAAFTAAGLSVESPQVIKDFIGAKRVTILTELAKVAVPFAVTSFPTSTSFDLVNLRGTAPIEVVDLAVNGLPVFTSWTSLTNWSIRFPLDPGIVQVRIDGRDRAGNPIPGFSQLLIITNLAVPEPPEGRLVVNEIQYNPARPGASFVELFNRSQTTTYNLVGWRLAGAGLTFDSLSFVPPLGYLVLPRNTVEFVAAHGATAQLGPELPGDLDNAGERLRLLRPGAEPGTETVVADVRYDNRLPWPPFADGTGASLQLIDAAQDLRRVGNWTAVRPSANLPQQTVLSLTNTWRYSGDDPGAADWRAAGFDDSAWPAGAALFHLEPAALPAPKNTPLPDVRPSWYFRTRFQFNGPTDGASLRLSPVIDDGAVVYLNGQEVFRLRLDPVPVDYQTTANSGVADAGLEGPFFVAAPSLVAGENVLAVEVKQASPSGDDVVFGLGVDVTYDRPGSLASPGFGNPLAAVLQPFPPLWLNELQPVNTTGPQDAAGDRDPWLEIHNASSKTVSLDGLGLADNYTNLIRWAFPAGRSIPPGGFQVVWLDAEPAETTANELHAGFRLPPDVGSVALVRLADGPRVLDYIDYDRPPADRTIGCVPEGDPYSRRLLHYPTLAATNNPASAPAAVFINEWMAANDATVADPADGDFDDWFELYNAASTPVDLAGFVLTDNLTNGTRFVIPPGYALPAGGFLLCWADGEPGQNASHLAGLHLPFKLDAAGEQIALLAPDGTLVDAVAFGPQATDVSAGRFPDGTGFFSPQALPTPGAPNFDPGSGNLSPIVAPIPDRATAPGQTLLVQVSAVDPDLPPQVLSYTLAPGAPPGAGINPFSGLFAWTPSPTAPPGSHPITVLVSDNGTPPRTSSDTFLVHILGPVALEATVDAGGGMRLEWSTIPGVSYRVYFKDDLEEVAWQPLGPPLTGTGQPMSIVDPDPARPRRFYLLAVE